MSGASEQANGRASGPVLQSVFLAVFDHSDLPEGFGEQQIDEEVDGTVEHQSQMHPKPQLLRSSMPGCREESAAKTGDIFTSFVGLFDEVREIRVAVVRFLVLSEGLKSNRLLHDLDFSCE